MIELKEITSEDILDECVSLQVSEDQASFVENNIYSLARAWLHYSTTRPFCIYNDGVMIGFVMLDWNEKHSRCGILEFMIDKKFQHKGFGKESLKVILEFIKSHNIFKSVYLTCNPQNTLALTLYQHMGFKIESDIPDKYGEITLIYNF